MAPSSDSTALPRDWGPYRLTGLLGVGGTARVYEARLIGPEALAEPVALKVLREDSTLPKAREMLLHEARVCALVRHPNVVDVIDAGETDGLPWIAMEQVRGQTLKRLLRDQGSLEPGPALDLLLQVASGLAALHDVRLPERRTVGLVHRDLKPANVIVDPEGRVRLVDFGIAVAADSEQVTEAWGTLAYMSPEQATGEPVTVTSDIFSFGALFYEVLTGEKLWPGRKPSEVIQALLRVDERLASGEPQAAVDEVLAGAGELLSDCLGLEPRARLPHGAALWDALDALQTPSMGDASLRVVTVDTIDQPLPSIRSAVTPRPGGALVGRRALLDTLASLDAPRACLWGPLGVGKSAVAGEHVARVRGLGHRAIRVPLRAALSPSSALQLVAQALDVPTAGLSSVNRGIWILAETLAARGPLLLVLDDADGCLASLPEWIGAWRTRAPELRVLVTARQALPGDTHALEVPLLEAADAVALLRRLAPQGTDEVALAALAHRVGGLPLALHLAADHEGTLGTGSGTIDLTDELPKQVRRSLRMAWNALSIDQQETLAACSRFAGGFTLADGVEVLTRAGLEQPGASLEALTERGLLRGRKAPSGRRLVLDQPLRGFAAGRLAEDPKREARVVLHHAGHYARLGTDAAVRHLRGPRATELQSRWVDERENLRTALVAALDNRWSDAAPLLGRALYETWNLGHPVDELDALGRRLSRMRRIAPADRLRLDLSRGRAQVLRNRRQRARDQLRTVIQRARERGEPTILCDALIQLTRVHTSSGRYPAAQTCIDEAQALAEQHGFRSLHAQTLRAQASLLRRYGRHHEGLEVIERASALCRALADRHLLAQVDSLAGLILLGMGEMAEAEHRLERAVGILRNTPDSHMLARQLGNLALVQHRAARLLEAKANLAEGLALFERMGALGEAAYLHQTFGSICMERGELEASLSSYWRALELYEGLDNRDQLAGAWCDLALALRHSGDLETAREKMERARDIAEGQGQALTYALVRVNLLDMLIGERRLAEAGDEAEALLRDPVVLGNKRVLAVARGLAGDVARLRGDPGAARTLLDLACCELEGADHASWADMVLRRARLDLAEGRLDAAAAVWRELMRFARDQELMRRAPIRLQAEHLGRELKRAGYPR